jgi:putative DNA primase/helicase
MHSVTPIHPSYQYMIEDLRRSGLTPKDIDVEVNAPKQVVGYRILYPGQPEMWRERRATGKRKYRQPAGQHGIWFRSEAEYARWAAADLRLIVEGEKKAAAAVKFLGLPAAGIGGCWGWSNDHQISPMLLQGSGEVWIVMDGDIQNRPDIQAAAGGLGRLLEADGCRVRVLALPAGEGADKVGLDDWLVLGNRLKQFRELPCLPLESLPKTRNERQLELGEMDVDRDAKGGIITNFTNTVKLIEAFFPDALYSDQYRGPFFNDERYQDEIHDARLQQELQKIHPKWPRAEIEAARRYLLATRQKNLTGQWLTSLKWDGRKRLETFFRKYCKSQQNPEYLADVARSLFVGMVLRCLQPGAKFDLLVTLVGEQGVGKTRLWDELAGHELCVETMFTRDGDNLMRVVSTAWVVNLDEFAGMSRTDERELKNWLTRTHDSWVPKYVEMSRTRERAFIVVGTTNEEYHLTDSTGNRRFAPVLVEEVDIEGVRKAREQLFAEAVALYREGYSHWVVRAAEDEQEAFRQTHPWEHEIREWLEQGEWLRLVNGTKFITLRRALWEVGITLSGKEQQDMLNHKQMGRLLRLLGLRRVKIRTAGLVTCEEPVDKWFKGGVPSDPAWVWVRRPG